MATEIIDIKGLQERAKVLDEHFSDFATALKSVNDFVNEHVHLDPNSAFYGQVGEKLLNLWNENAATFSDFHENFQMWSNAVAAITATTSSMIEKVFRLYASHGDNLSGVQENRENKKDESAFTGEEIEVEGLETVNVVDTGFYGGTSAGDAYKITSDNRTAEQIYQDALDLRQTIYTEEQYLCDYMRDLEFSRGALEAANASSAIDKNEYDKLIAEYDARIAACKEEIAKRHEIYNELSTITADNIVSSDGVLKDARDWGANNIVVAQEAIVSVNEKASNLCSVASISSEINGDGTSKNAMALSALKSPEMGGDYGAYTDNINGIVSKSSVSNLTFKSAYASAQGNVLELKSDEGVYLFNTSDYLLKSDVYNTTGTYGVGDSSVLSLSSRYEADGKFYDSVYDSKTGNYYTYEEWNTLKQNGQ